MNGESHPIIVEAGVPGCHASSAVLVHHRDYPEIRVEGRSAFEAAGRLFQLLASALDGAPDHWHRGDLQRALADIQDFLDRSGPAGGEPS